LNRLAIKEVKKVKKMRNLHVGLENGNEIEKCYKLLFYSYLQLKKKICALENSNFELKFNLQMTILAIALLIMDTIAWNIFIYFPQLMTPQSGTDVISS
jgi:hypothetical protein